MSLEPGLLESSFFDPVVAYHTVGELDGQGFGSFFFQIYREHQKQADLNVFSPAIPIFLDFGAIGIAQFSDWMSKRSFHPIQITFAYL